MLFVCGRHLVFNALLQLKKSEFRAVVLKQSAKETTPVFIKAADIFRDVNGIEWKEDFKEMVIDGKYHEVVSITKVGNGYLVSVIADDKENGLFRNYLDIADARTVMADCFLMLFSLSFDASQQIGFVHSAPTRIDFGTEERPSTLAGHMPVVPKPPRTATA